MVNIPLFTGFYTCQVVVWDFFHQQLLPDLPVSDANLEHRPSGCQPTSFQQLLPFQTSLFNGKIFETRPFSMDLSKGICTKKNRKLPKNVMVGQFPERQEMQREVSALFFFSNLCKTLLKSKCRSAVKLFYLRGVAKKVFGTTLEVNNFL